MSAAYHGSDDAQLAQFDELEPELLLEFAGFMKTEIEQVVARYFAGHDRA
ncbi:hypothetical protein [Paenibacillus aceti]|uniref:Uncharacterized protein n=1 Tax=Paenibacillus aceti TaxID=1820010 RepID=A0ABQ1VSE4_9BACL|nr:hypothetical protein [Paenibacillus aceti]GGF95047.1 hypothetical protein GCM10010913_15760 [Paenibacillus aceti]